MPYNGVTTTWPVKGTGVGCTPDLASRSGSGKKLFYTRRAFSELFELINNRIRYYSWFDSSTYYDLHLTSSYTTDSKTIKADYIDKHPNMDMFISYKGIGPVNDHFHHPMYYWDDLLRLIEGIYYIPVENMAGKSEYTIDSKCIKKLETLSNEYKLGWTISEIWTEFCVGMDVLQTEDLLRRKYLLVNSGIQECIKIRWGSCWQDRIM